MDDVLITLFLTEHEADMLRTNSMRNFVPEQDGRFEPIEPGATALDSVFQGGTLHWCETGSDMLLLAAYERACGYTVILLSDETAGMSDPFVVLTSRPWIDFMGAHGG